MLKKENKIKVIKKEKDLILLIPFSKAQQLQTIKLFQENLK